MATKKVDFSKGLSEFVNDRKKQEAEEMLAANGYRIEDIPLSRIVISKYQPRIKITPESILDLKESFAQNGQYNPITVRPTQSGEFELIGGERRYRAAKELGWTVIRAQIKSASETTAATQAVLENIQNDALSDYEIAKGIGFVEKAYRESGEPFTVESLCKRLGMSTKDYYRYKKFSELPSRVHELLHENPTILGRSAAERIVQELVSLQRVEMDGYLIEALRMVERQELYQTNIVPYVLSELEKQGRPITVNSKQVLKLAHGKSSYDELKGIFSLQLRDELGKQLGSRIKTSDDADRLLKYISDFQ